MRTVKTIVALALVVLAAACEKGVPDLAGPEMRLGAATGKIVPLKGTFAFQTTAPVPIARCEVGEIGVRATKVGNATHLGRFTAVSTYCVDPATLAITRGKTIFTAANGDQLFTTFSGRLTGSPPVFGVEIALTITGGTGRFSGASGSASVVGDFDTAAGAGTASLDGVISSLGASKR